MLTRKKKNRSHCVWIVFISIVIEKVSQSKIALVDRKTNTQDV